LSILIFKLLDSRREDKSFWTEWQQALPEFNLLLISSQNKYSFVVVVVEVAAAAVAVSVVVVAVVVVVTVVMAVVAVVMAVVAVAVAAVEVVIKNYLYQSLRLDEH
jgi:hypothetical protein